MINGQRQTAPPMRWAMMAGVFDLNPERTRQIEQRTHDEIVRLIIGGDVPATGR